MVNVEVGRVLFVLFVFWCKKKRSPIIGERFCCFLMWCCLLFFYSSTIMPIVGRVVPCSLGIFLSMYLVGSLGSMMGWLLLSLATFKMSCDLVLNPYMFCMSRNRFRLHRLKNHFLSTLVSNVWNGFVRWSFSCV